MLEDEIVQIREWKVQRAGDALPREDRHEHARRGQCRQRFARACRRHLAQIECSADGSKPGCRPDRQRVGDWQSQSKDRRGQHAWADAAGYRTWGRAMRRNGSETAARTATLRAVARATLAVPPVART